MEDFSAFTKGERTPLAALEARGVRFVLVGLSAAVLQGANTGTRDIDLWFENLSDPRISGAFGMRPPQLGGEAIGDRLDVVTHVDGVGTFAEEYPGTLVVEVDGLRLHVLALERILASKRAARRPKDLAAIPALEEALAALRDDRAK